MMKTIKKLAWSILSLSFMLQLNSCSMIDEDECQMDHINYRYVNSAGTDDMDDRIYTMTDFIFTKDSVLYRVDENWMNDSRRKRYLDLPDGEWTIVTYGNLSKNSRIEYTVGQTRFSEMSLRVATPPAYAESYADASAETAPPVGDADQLYYGKLDLTVKDGYTNQIHYVDMSNVHIRINGIIKWINRAGAPSTANKNLNVRFEYVPVEHSFLTDTHYDKDYQIEFHTPRITEERSAYITKLKYDASDDAFRFSASGLRWETGGAPLLRIYDGDTPLVGKELPLNKYFNDNAIDLTNTRIQYFNLEIKIEDTEITISDMTFEDWEDGGNI